MSVLQRAEKSTALAIVEENELTRPGFTINRAEAHLREHLTDEEMPWCNPGCMARAVWGQCTETFRREILQRHPRLRKELWQRSLLLVTAYGERGRVLKFKLWEGEGSTEEELAAQVMLARLQRHGEITEAQAREMRELLEKSPVER